MTREKERERERSLEVAEAHLHDAQPRLLPLVRRLGGRLEDPMGLEAWGWAYVPGLVLGWAFGRRMRPPSLGLIST